MTSKINPAGAPRWAIDGGLVPTWQSWRSMWRRCTDTKDRAYRWYQGVVVHPAWESFDQFLTDVGIRPPGLSLDRIKAELGYVPGNVRWANRRTQARNRRSTRLSVQHAAEIRRLVAGGQSRATVAQVYGVTFQLVSQIVAGRIWVSDPSAI